MWFLSCINASQIARDSKASLFSLFAVKLGVIKAGENGSTCENRPPTHVQGKQQKKGSSVSFSLSVFHLYNL